jgi:hypothetical protein
LFKEIASSPHMVHLQIAFVPMKQMKDWHWFISSYHFTKKII